MARKATGTGTSAYSVKLMGACLRWAAAHVRPSLNIRAVARVRTSLNIGAVARVRPGLSIGAVARVRPSLNIGAVARVRPSLNIGAVVAHMLTIVGLRFMGIMMVPRLAQYMLRVFMNGRVQAAVRSGAGVMPRGMVRRHRAVVNVCRRMPVAVVPGGRTPVRHKAQRSEGCYCEDGSTGGGIAIDRSSVIVTIYREAVGIIAGACPGNG